MMNNLYFCNDEGPDNPATHLVILQSVDDQPKIAALVCQDHFLKSDIQLVLDKSFRLSTLGKKNSGGQTN